MSSNKILSIAVAGFFTLLASCGGSSERDPPLSTLPPPPQTTPTAPAAAIALTATPSGIQTSGTSALLATVTTSTGGNVPNGTSVTFSLSNNAMGTLSSTSATTSAGQAGVTFTAGTVPGTVAVTATAGSVSQTTPITITSTGTGTIEFISATPPALGVRGSGQTETSIVRFRVRDVNGNPAADGTSVNFTMAGPSGGRAPSQGGEFIGTDDGTPTTATAVTTGGKGEAAVTLTSGSIAGAVTIGASVVTPTGTASASSSVLSIGGAIPSSAHFSLAASRLNLPGLVLFNAQSTITALIADRFGNFNILAGTTVSFYTEGGAIDANNVVGADGTTSVVFRTQAPQPANVAITTSELDAINNLNRIYAAGGINIPIDGTVHPRDGWVSLLATVNGEESFTDKNGNGVYDPSVDDFPATMDLGEPYTDINDSGTYDTDDTFVDVNNNGGYDGPNGVWDGPGCTEAGCQQTKTIWTTHTLAFTGNATNATCVISPSGFSIPNGGSRTFQFMVGDQNLNRMVPGTTITVTATRGTLVGQTNYIVPDGIGGPSEIKFTLQDNDSSLPPPPPPPPAPPPPTPPPATAAITVTVTPPVAERVSGCQSLATGTIQ